MTNDNSIAKGFAFCPDRKDNTISYDDMNGRRASSTLDELCIMQAAVEKHDPARAHFYNRLADILVGKLSEGHVFVEGTASTVDTPAHMAREQRAQELRPLGKSVLAYSS